MSTLKFDTSKSYGKFKVLNATNGGPWTKRHAGDMYRDNFREYEAANFKYSRNHDSAACMIYGGPYSHDITSIFPNFDADPYDPASYDFICTDESILTTLDAGVETYFRLGQTIEHQIKKHGTLPPKDFNKWAIICEHIIRHYNEGWADGFKLDIQYWEIWNEPDLDDNDPNPEHKRTWSGTRYQFFDMYEIAAKHLKSCFPNIKVGGPALSWNNAWGDEFLGEMQKRGVEIDFFSWHQYGATVEKIKKRAEIIKEMLVKHGYDKTESILNEWNYVIGWTDEFAQTIMDIHGINSAAFVMATISEAQKWSTMDMMMYYDTRPSAFCGVFDFYSYKTLPTYYALAWYGNFYDMEYEIRTEDNIPNVHTLCGVDKDGKTLSIVTYYSNEKGLADQEVTLDFGKSAEYEIYLTDADTKGELVKKTSNPTVTLKQNTFVLIKEI